MTEILYTYSHLPLTTTSTLICPMFESSYSVILRKLQDEKKKKGGPLRPGIFKRCEHVAQLPNEYQDLREPRFKRSPPVVLDGRQREMRRRGWWFGTAIFFSSIHVLYISSTHLFYLLSSFIFSLKN